MKALSEKMEGLSKLLRDYGKDCLVEVGSLLCRPSPHPAVAVMCSHPPHHLWLLYAVPALITMVFKHHGEYCVHTRRSCTACF
jgi:hypothetical protein